MSKFVMIIVRSSYEHVYPCRSFKICMLKYKDIFYNCLNKKNAGSNILENIEN